MRVVWNELTPRDRYLVRMKRPVSISEMGYLTHLYLPLIGAEAYTLYQLLLHEVDQRSGAVAQGAHRTLMLMTSLPLDRLLAARERLEAMNLLEVIRRENREGDYFFEYVIKPPLTPGQFFQEEMWAVMLFNAVEKAKYEQLRRTYADQEYAQLDRDYPYVENVTKRFYEVFQSLSASEVEVRQGSETERIFRQLDQDYPAVPMDGDYQAEASAALDLSFIRLSLPSNADAGKVLTADNIAFLYQILYFYQISSWLMGQELRDWNLYTAAGQLDREAVRSRFREKYVDGQLPREQVELPDPALFAPGNLPEPGNARYASICRQFSPLVLLETVVGGRINKTFLERAEGLFFADNMPAEVVNALLLYVLRETNMELPRAYVETVRDSWKARQISTVDEVVAVILERNEARQQASSQAKNTRETGSAPRRAGRPLVKDKLPASVQRQLEREQQEAEGKQIQSEPKRTVMDDPELRALLESYRQQRGDRR